MGLDVIDNYITIVRPKVELIEVSKNRKGINHSHIAKCARVCYGKENDKSNKEKDIKTFKNLSLNGHTSMFRHNSMYFIIDVRYLEVVDIRDIVDKLFEGNPFVDYDILDNAYIYMSTNFEYIYNNENYINDILNNQFGLKNLFEYEVTPAKFCDKEIGHYLMRYTFKITTNISCSRELNRVSPNNIAERSTRYVRQNSGDCIGTICLHRAINFLGVDNEKPIVYNANNKNACFRRARNNEVESISLDIPQEALLSSAFTCFEKYKYALDCRVKLDVAKDILPLSTMTIVIYTYSVRKWKHIIDLRYHGTTGTPHPHAREVIGMVRDELYDLGYEL